MVNFCETIQMIEGKDDEQLIQYKLIGSQFSKDPDSIKSKTAGYNQIFDFPLEAKTNLIEIDEEKKRKLEIKLNNIKIVQRRYPEALHDYTEYDNLIRNLRAIENKKSIEIYAKNYFDDLIVIYQGNMLKYGRSQKNTAPLKLKDNHTFELMIKKDAKECFKYIDFQFTSDTQIIKLVETAEKDVIQIFAEDYHSEIITVVTWDFQNNIERTMF